MADSLTLTDETPDSGFERLIFAEDPDSGLRAYISLHSTVCGPAAGGCRMWPYESLAQARADAQRLSKGMTYKNAIADLGLGGGKSVIIGDARTDKTPQMFRAFGRAVQQLGGQYYTAEDVGISTDDMAIVAQETDYAVGLDSGDFASGDPSPYTAEGVFRCMKVGAAQAFGSDDLTGKRVLLQGLGHVGMSLAGKLHAAGAQLVVADINAPVVAQAVEQFGAIACDTASIMTQPGEICAPCALGGTLTHQSVETLHTPLICGAANNQLGDPTVADLLRARGVVYLPDYVVNGGGIISVAGEIHKRGNAYRAARLDGIATRMQALLQRAEERGQTTTQVADEMVEEILAAARRERP